MDARIQAVNRNKEQIMVLSAVAAAYGDLAGQKLSRIRDTIEKNRRYVNELANVFHVVKTAAEEKKIVGTKQKSGTVNLVITSNHRFYGGLETRLLSFFMAHSVLSFGKTIVVGTYGQEFLRSAGFNSAFESISLQEDIPSTFEMADLISRILSYEKVLVYHSKMQTVLLTRPSVEEIGGLADISSSLVSANSKYYIFEPELPLMIDFFDRQVVGIFLEQAFLESELARTSARLVSMDDIDNKTKEQMITLSKQLSIAKRANLNMHLLEMNLTTKVHEGKGNY